MTTVSRYNHTAKLFANREVSLQQSPPNLYVMLLTAGSPAPVFDATHTTVDEVAGALEGSPLERAFEVYGFGWAQGGQPLENVVVSVDNTNEAQLDADPISITINGGSLGPTAYALIYDADGMQPLIWVDFEEEHTAGQGTQFRFVPNANGIVRWNVPA